MSNKRRHGRHIPKPFKISVALVFSLLGFTLLFGSRWLFRTYGDMPFEQILYHVIVPLEGVESGLVWDFVAECIPWAAVISIVIVIPWFIKDQYKYTLLVSWNSHTGRINISRFTRFIGRHIISICALILIGLLINAAYFIGLPEFIELSGMNTTIYEDEYVPPQTATLTFPEHPRNVIVIFLESMETAYTSTEYGGSQQENYIPHLTDIAIQNTSFSGGSPVGGMYDMGGYTTGALVTHLFGLPISISGDIINSGGLKNHFMPGAYMLGDILMEHGYNQELLIGSDAVFGSRKLMFEEHGNFEIFDYYTAVERKYIPEEYYEWWGYEDEKLYEYAKQELLALAQKDEPFCFITLTADTHSLDGYVCELCENEYPDQYSNVIACADRQINDFITWLQQQPFYEDTAVVVLGDHLSMNAHYFTDPEYERLVYNTYINASVQPSNEKNQLFTSYDTLPTVLAAMGVQIEGDRLGFGVNLFSDTPTLASRMGVDALRQELGKNSMFYKMNILDPADYLE